VTAGPVEYVVARSVPFVVVAARITLAPLIALAVLLAPGAAAAAKGPQVKANARLLSLAGPYPGAKLVRVESDPYRAPDNDDGPIVGYTTVAYYALAKPVARHLVASFYKRELRGWRENVTTTPCEVVSPPPGTPTGTTTGHCPGVTSVSFTMGDALIQIQGLDSGAHYGLAIDSEYGRNAH
jgi:hypothetical protein